MTFPATKGRGSHERVRPEGAKLVAPAIGRWLRAHQRRMLCRMLLTLEVCTVRSGRTNALVFALDPAPGFRAAEILGSLPVLAARGKNRSRTRNTVEREIAIHKSTIFNNAFVLASSVCLVAVSLLSCGICRVPCHGSMMHGEITVPSQELRTLRRALSNANHP